MCKENLDKTESNKRTPLENVKKIIPKIPVLLAIVIVASVVIKLEKNIERILTTELIELDTTEKTNYIIDVFHIKATNNIGSYTVSFHEGVMTVMLNDVKDIHELCFENLEYYELTEEDYNEIVGTPFEKRESLRSWAPVSKVDERWVSSYYQGVRFENKIENHFIFLCKKGDSLCCEISTGWGKLEDLEKLRSMN